MSPPRPPHAGPHDGHKVLVDGNHPAVRGAPHPRVAQPGLEVAPAWLASDERGAAPGLQVLAGPHLYAEDENPAPQASHPPLAGPRLYAEDANPAPHVTHQPYYQATDAPQALVAEDLAHSTASRASPSWEKDEATPASAHGASAARKRWRLWVVMGLVAVLVVVGAVLGGVLGSKAAAKGGTTTGTTASDASADDTSSNGTSVSPGPGSIKRNSRLAVTGQRSTSNYSQKIRLFHQGPDDTIQYVDWTSTGSEWSKACKMNTLDHRPMPNGSFTTCTYRETHNNLNQWQLFYVDDTNTVRGQKFDVDGGTPTGRTALINEYPLQVGPDTRLGCYWPYIVSQDADAGLRWTLHQGPWVDGKTYYVNDTNLTAEAAAAGTPLVALPVTQAFEDAAGFVYRGADGRVRTGVRTYGAGPAQEPAWEQGAALAAPVPAGAALAAFAVGQPYSADRLNTYVLYQDAAGVLQVLWQDGDGDDEAGGWQGPRTYAALADAAPGTDIACVTQGGGPGSAVQKAQDMNRCFFQERDTGRLKEVWFDGAEWKAVGFVPVDYGDGRCT